MRRLSAYSTLAVMPDGRKVNLLWSLEFKSRPHIKAVEDVTFYLDDRYVRRDELPEEITDELIIQLGESGTPLGEPYDLSD